MAAADDSGPIPDLYQVLGVSRGASSGEITRAWRRRALAEHPDRKPRDAAAPARFGVLAEAYRVLGDPARRAAYDRSLTDRDAACPHGVVQSSGPPSGQVGRAQSCAVFAGGSFFFLSAILSFTVLSAPS